MVRNVAIWGSCVTRDAFALADRQEWIEERLPLVYYGARSSWVSQASRPLAVETGDLNGFPRRMVAEDAEKTVIDSLVAAQPDIVVLDLVDERLPILRHDQTWLTQSEYLRRVPDAEQLVEGADEVVAMPRPRRVELFDDAARRLARTLRRRLPATAFVLNEAPYTTRVGDGSQLPEPQAGWARALQAGQEPLVASLVRHLGDRLLRARPPRDVCLADPDHRWGVTAYHYVESYYHWLLDLLDAVEPPSGPDRGIAIRLPEGSGDVVVDLVRWARRMAGPR